MTRFLIWLGLRKPPPVPLHLIPWRGRIIVFGVASSIARAHESTGWPRPWRIRK